MAPGESRALQDDYYKTPEEGLRRSDVVDKQLRGCFRSVPRGAEGPSLDSKQQSGSMQEEDCMQGTSAQEEMAVNNHRNVGLDQVITWWPNLLNASLYPINRHLSRSDAGL